MTLTKREAYDRNLFDSVSDAVLEDRVDSGKVWVCGGETGELRAGGRCGVRIWETELNIGGGDNALLSSSEIV